MKWFQTIKLIRSASSSILLLETASSRVTSECNLSSCSRLSVNKIIVHSKDAVGINKPVDHLEGVARGDGASLVPVSYDASSNGDVTDIEGIEDLSSNDALSVREIKLDDVPRNFPVSCNLAAYVNRSETLQQFLKLGVDLSHWDNKPGAADLVIGLDFARDVKPRLQFLHDVGVATDELGRYLTSNPYVLREDEDDLQVRVNYLRSKKFSKFDIARIVTAAPLFLQRTTESIDGRLGYFQREFRLSGNEVRFVAARMPKLLTCPFAKIKENQFILKEEFGFEPHELRQLLKTKPKLWVIGRKSLHERFDYLHNTMGISHELIVHFPGGLIRRVFAVKQRHLYLVSLGRAQYDPKRENYVSLEKIVVGSDADFCLDVAKTSVEMFNDFLKTL